MSLLVLLLNTYEELNSMQDLALRFYLADFSTVEMIEPWKSEGAVWELRGLGKLQFAADGLIFI